MTRSRFPAPLGSGFPFDTMFDSPFFKRFASNFEEFEVTKYPPVNVDFVKPSDEEADPFYRFQMAVAGYSKEDLQIKVDGSIISITGEKSSSEETEEAVENILSQMAFRKFTRSFTFGSMPVEVRSAKCVDGVLSLEVHFLRPPEGELITIE